MKKKILLILLMFMFITNVSALTFNVDVTNIEDKGNNGTIGSITNIDVANKTLSILFSDSSDQVLFEVTVSNSGDRAGTLKNINITMFYKILFSFIHKIMHSYNNEHNII
jgi:hypothetical protein